MRRARASSTARGGTYMLTLVGGEHGGNDAVAVGCQLGARRFVCGGRSSVSAARQRRRTRLHHRRTDRIAHAAAAPQTLGARAWQTTRAAASARHPRMPAGEGPSMMMVRHHHPVLRPPSPFSHSQKDSHELVRHERCLRRDSEREVQKKNGSGRANSTGARKLGRGAACLACGAWVSTTAGRLVPTSSRRTPACPTRTEAAWRRTARGPRPPRCSGSQIPAGACSRCPPLHPPSAEAPPDARRPAGRRAQCAARSARGASALCLVLTRARPQVPLSSEDSSAEWEVQEVCAGGDFTVVHARYVCARSTRACPRCRPAVPAPQPNRTTVLPHGHPPARRPLWTSARARAPAAQHGASLRRVNVAGPSTKTDALKRGSVATSPTDASASQAACSTGASAQLPKQLRARCALLCPSHSLC